MPLKSNLKSLYRKVHAPIFKLINQAKNQYECPICHYLGAFEDFDMPTGTRRDAKRPNCGALERHRIQFLVLNKVLPQLDSNAKILHFAPEDFFKPIFQKKFRNYETADLFMDNVTHKFDIQDIPFKDNSYDFIYASHVLEHIPDDKKALQEIYRILKPCGIAILPVPIICNETVEYSEPNPYEAMHVRAPGIDYYMRYENIFDKIKTYSSTDFNENHQLYIYENREIFPNQKCPERPLMTGEKHTDIVPVCYKHTN